MFFVLLFVWTIFNEGTY